MTAIPHKLTAVLPKLLDLLDSWCVTCSARYRKGHSPHEDEKREVARRLARREGRPPPESLPKQATGAAIPEHPAARSSSKKSPRLGTFGQLVEAWCNARHAKQEQILQRQIPPQLKALTPHQVMRPQIVSLTNTWADTLSPNTAHHYISSLRRMCKFIDEATGAKLAPMVPRGPAPEIRTITATDQEFARLTLFAPAWFRTFLLLTRTLAMRKSEALAITPANYNPQTNRLDFHRKMEGSSQIPLTPELASIFAQCAESAPIAPVIQTLAGFPPCDNTLYRQWQRAKRRAGISRALTFHDLRRTACEQVYNRTKDLRICQRLLGHRNIRSTLNYVGGFNSDELRQAILDAAPKDIHALPLATERPQ